jgi:uncharacterized phage protein (TIGR02220 family)
MALTDQPYLPLFVRDWLSNLKLKTCKAESHGIMINTMCLMHLSETYGKILLNQKFKQTDKQILNFASQLAKFLPFDLLEVQKGLTELIDEKALIIDGDFLICKRMVKDAEISTIRANIGKEGGEKSAKNRGYFAQAKGQANDEAKGQANTVIEYAIEIVNYFNKVSGKNYEPDSKQTIKFIKSRFKEKFTLEDFKKVIDLKCGQWKNDDKMKQYIRPETLFGSKFESYLNEIPRSGNKIKNVVFESLEPNPEWTKR